MTIQTARADCVQDLVDSGKWSRAEISACGDYGLLQGIATCGIIMQPGDSSFEIDAYGLETEDEWGLSLECYLPVGRDVIDAMARSWQMIDDVRAAVKSGSNLNGPAHRLAWVSAANRPRLAFAEIGGHEYIPVFITVTVKE